MGMTLLMLAVIRNDASFARMLLDNNIDINAQTDDEELNTALHFALIFGNVDMARLLTSRSSIKTNLQNGFGDTGFIIFSNRSSCLF